MRVGFLVTYGAFAYGCVVVAFAVGRAREFRLRPGVCGWFAVLAVGSLAFPAIEFPSETLNGFRGLDLLSVLSVVALATVTVVATALRVPATLCLVGILAGNVLIQHFTTRGSTDRYGLVVATAAAAASLLSALVGVRGADAARR